MTATATTMASIVRPTKSPEAESETPPPIQPSKPNSFTNGVLKRHNHAPAMMYKECLKNHAASLGGHALDGCGEFMPAPTATSKDPTSLKCAACGCHRNFHRREAEETAVIEYHPYHRHHPFPPLQEAREVHSPGSQSQSPPPISSSRVLFDLSGGGRAHTATTTTTNGPHNHNMMMVNTTSSRKRFRTKFSQEQKERMQEFAEKVGWKMHKNNDEIVNGFCNEIGVERGVFKVWMHNNKNTFGKRSALASAAAADPPPPPSDAPANCGTNPPVNHNYNGNDNNNNKINNDDEDYNRSSSHQQYNGKSQESNAPTNASSSSS